MFFFYLNLSKIFLKFVALVSLTKKFFKKEKEKWIIKKKKKKKEDFAKTKKREKKEKKFQRFSKINCSNFKRRIQISKSKK